MAGMKHSHHALLSHAYFQPKPKKVEAHHRILSDFGNFFVSDNGAFEAFGCFDTRISLVSVQE